MGRRGGAGARGRGGRGGTGRPGRGRGARSDGAHGAGDQARSTRRSAPDGAAADGATAPRTPRTEPRGDCARCFGLCCVALPFSRSADFPVDKPGGSPCGNLRADFGCSIHEELRPRGWTGCTVFDCHGAGQQVSQVTFAGEDWRGSPDAARRMFAVFAVMRPVHELLAYVADALDRPETRPVHAELRRARTGLSDLAGADADTVLAADVGALRAAVNPALLRAGDLVRARSPRRGPVHRGADLAGARLRGADLRGASLRGALLIGADLRDADLRWADLIGADLRGADLSGADLRGSVYATGTQLAAARGDAATRLPGAVRRPAHWATEGTAPEEAARTGS
nr:pentapeptide repeat-containing protein [Streptomyces albidoflavus]